MRARSTRRPSLARAGIALAVLAAAGVVSADAPASSRYAFGATVSVAPDVRPRFEFNGRLYALPLGSVTVDVAGQAREAFAAVARGMFETAGDPAVLVGVTVSSSDVAVTGTSGRAIVEHDVVARTPAGTEISRWHVRGESRIGGLEDSAVVRAFARAAQNAASAFEEQFDASEAVRGWLAERGFARRVAPPRPPPAAPIPPRDSVVSFVELGVPMDADTVIGFAARAGVAGPRWYVALAFEGSDASFAAAPPFGRPEGDATLYRNALGADAALLRRWRYGLEWLLGAGGRIVGGTATLGYTLANGTRRSLAIEKWALAGSGFTALRATTRPLTSLRLRARAAVEVRATFGGALTYDAFQTTVEPATFSAAVLLGFELPVSRSRPDPVP